MTRRRWGFFIAGLGVIAVEPALGQMAIPVAEVAQPPAVQLSPNDRINVRGIEDYLNSIKTVRARFRQVSLTDVAEGYLYIQRPGRIRMEYDPPVPILIVSDGSFLIYYDRQLEQVTYLPLSSTPASVLTRDNIAFLGGDVIITGFEQHCMKPSLIEAPNVHLGSAANISASTATFGRERYAKAQIGCLGMGHH